MTFRVPARVLIGGVLLSGAVGCGSPASAPEPNPSSSAPATAEHGAFAHCLSEHGVAEPAGESGVDQATWDSARQACASLAPGPGPGPATP